MRADAVSLERRAPFKLANRGQLGRIAREMRDLRREANEGVRTKPSTSRLPSIQYDTIEFELRETGLALGTSMVASLFLGSVEFWNIKVVGRLQRASGGVEFIDFGTFRKFMSQAVEFLQGYDRQRGEEHLQECRDRLRQDGWDELPRGQYWYSLRFRRMAQ